MVDCADADAAARLVLAADVDLRRGVVPDQDRGEPELAELRDLGRDLLLDARREGAAVHQRRRHRRARFREAGRR